MRFTKAVMMGALALLLSTAAVAEVQNVELDGTIRIRGNLYDMDTDGTYTDFEQRTLLGVRADFTDNVSAYIQLDNYSQWGEDFRSMDWESGYDDRATIDGDGFAEVEVYQSYIEANELWGTPLNLRLGRQEILLGSEWLIGNNDTAAVFWGLSYDAIRLDYATDMFTISGIAAKVEEEVFGDFLQEDDNLYILYGTYSGLEDIDIDAYYMFLQDEGAGDEIHTFGLRGAGVIGAFDFEAEAAWQDQTLDSYGTSGDAFAVNLTGGYSFDTMWSPHIYLGFTWFEGDPDDNVAFNRLFSDWEYGEYIDGTGMTNTLVYRAGVDFSPTESLDVSLLAMYFMLDEEGADPADIGLLVPGLVPGEDELGWEAAIYATYTYSEDLAFEVGYSHFFGGDAIVGEPDWDYVYWQTVLTF